MHTHKTPLRHGKWLILAFLAGACGSSPTPHLVLAPPDVATDAQGDLTTADDATPTDALEPGDAIEPGDATLTADVSPHDAEPVDAIDAGTEDAGPDDALDDGGADDGGPVDSGPVDVGPGDSGPVDSGPVDSGPLDSGPDVPTCTPAQCDDGNACTTDGCDAQGQCTHATVTGCLPPAALPCTSSADCKGGVCDPAGHLCVACLSHADCGTGKVCLGSAGSQACQVAPACTSDSQCKATKQVCSKAIGVCVDCLDSNDCGGGLCVNTQCQAVPPKCASSKDCPGVLVCDKGSGQCVGCLTSADCPATSFCTSGQQCAADVCSAGVCGPGAALFACKADGSGYEAGKACDDANPCTDNVCQPGTGCTYPAGSGPCTDGSACTGGDTCQGGKCVGGPAISCDDGNPCTDDLCNPVGGCSHSANSAPCDDGDACTTADKCQGASCVGGGVKNCDDGNACTDDSCAKNACVHSANNVPCDDGKGCTTGDKCSGGVCQGGGPKTCVDNDECTTDSCDAATGTCVFTKKPGCVPSVAAPCVDTDCAAGYCDPTMHACLPCLQNSHCAQGSVCIASVCKVQAGCSSDTQCKATGQVCNTAQKACVDCNSKTDCSSGQACIDNTCVAAAACASSKDCPKVCNTSKGQCVECVTSVDCPSGKWCDKNGMCQAALCKTQACWKGSLYVCKSDGGGYANPVACQDGNACTDDGCDATAGCSHVPNTASCSGGTPEACASQCQAGSCVSKGPYLFDKTYGGAYEDHLNGVLPLSDGYLISGRSYTGTDYGWVVRTDLAGTKSWDKTYGSNGYNSLNNAVVAGSGFALVGTRHAASSTPGGNGNDDLWLLKIQGNGTVELDKVYGGSGTERGYGIVATGGGYLLAGRSDKTGSTDGWIVRTDAGGGKVWDFTFGTTGYDSFYDVAATGDGGFVLIGTAQPKAGDYDGWVVRVDGNGAKLWDKTYGTGKNDWFNGLAQLADGGLALVGQASSGSDNAMWLLRADKTGAALWTKTYDAVGLVQGEGVVALPDGYQILGTITNDGKGDVWTVRTDASGNSVWDQKLGGTADDDAAALVQGADGGVAIGAETASKGAGSKDAWLLRVDAWGSSSCAASGACLSLATADCNDGNACTADSCSAQKGCTHTAIANCCTSAAECDDGNACTVDTCATGNLCKHAFSSGPGCVCDPNLFTDDFESGTLAPVSQSGSSTSVLWQVDCKDLANGGKCALYYGNPAQGNFENGATNYGTATLPSVTLPAGKSAALAFSTWLDVESNTDYDKLSVTVTPAGGTATTLWSKASSGVKMQAWQNWTLDLSAYAGKTVTIRIDFNSIDATENAGKGIFVDDVAVTRGCP